MIINKSLIAPTSIQTHILRQGRAMMMRIKWADTEELNIMNIYIYTERKRTTPGLLGADRRRKHLLGGPGSSP